MQRRDFIGFAGAAAAAWPLSGHAQQPARPQLASTSKIKPAEAIADFITGFKLESAPPLVVERARVALIDTVGVMLGGSQHHPTDIIVDMIRREGSRPAATVVGQPLRASLQMAALANGVSAHAMDFDLTYFAGQAMAGLIPAILPVAETTNASPQEILSALIIGAEVCGRMSRVAPTMFRLADWHATGTVGTMAAAAACARLMKAPRAAIIDAMGITASLASGVTVNFGTMTKPLHAGNAARNGVLAVQLAMRGFTSSASALEGRTGFFENFGRGFDKSLAPFEDLGSKWDLVEVGYKLKPYPSGGLGHTAIDAALELRGTVPLSEIRSVEVAITKYAGRRYSSNYPDTAEAAKFSGPYLASYTLIHGAPMLEAFTDKALADEKVRAFAPKVSLTTYQEHADVLDESPAKVTLTLNDGRKLEKAKYYPTGSVQVPMSRERIEAKFMTCATTAIRPAAAKQVLALLSTVATQKSFKPLWPLLTKT